MGEAEKETFELHFFGCPRCLEEVRALQLARDVLERDLELRGARTDPRGTGVRWLWWASLAAAAALAIVAVRVRLGQIPEPPAEPIASAESASPETTQTGSESEPAIPAEAPTVEPTLTDEQADHRALLLASLATIEPPPYERVVLRGVADETSRQFDRGMAAYLARDFQGAVESLRIAASSDPDRPDIGLYLGVSLLLAGATDDAASELARTAGLGDPVFSEEAWFYLAKAHLRTGETEKARIALRRVTEPGGPLAVEAEQILEQLEALP